MSISYDMSGFKDDKELITWCDTNSDSVCEGLARFRQHFVSIPFEYAFAATNKGEVDDSHNFEF